MKIIDLLNKIANGEIENGTIICVNGDFFYDLIVIDESLYVINSVAKNLELLESKYIGRFIIDNVELEILNDEVEVIEDIPKEDKKIEKIKDRYCSQISKVELAQKINEIIDRLNGDSDE